MTRCIFGFLLFSSFASSQIIQFENTIDEKRERFMAKENKDRIQDLPKQIKRKYSKDNIINRKSAIQRTLAEEKRSFWFSFRVVFCKLRHGNDACKFGRGGSDEPTISLYPTLSPAIQSKSPSHPSESSVLSNLSTRIPSHLPTRIPTNVPTILPSSEPSSTKSNLPSNKPSFTPTAFPSLNPSLSPSVSPSSSPSMNPSLSPSISPSSSPSLNPSLSHSASPSSSPSLNPSLSPTTIPSNIPTTNPSLYPSNSPSTYPTNAPSLHLSDPPTLYPLSDQETCNFSEKAENSRCRNTLESTHDDSIYRSIMEDQFICSLNQRYYFGMTKDQSLCLCDNRNLKKIWCVDESECCDDGEDPYFELEKDGNLAVYSEKKIFSRFRINMLWESGTEDITNDNGPVQLKLHNNGELTLEEISDTSRVHWKVGRQNGIVEEERIYLDDRLKTTKSRRDS